MAVNRDGEIVIIGLKKDFADKEVISQILGYQIECRENIEVIKNLWHDSKNKPEDLEPDWENYNPRVMVVAPPSMRS